MNLREREIKDNTFRKKLTDVVNFFFYKKKTELKFIISGPLLIMYAS